MARGWESKSVEAQQDTASDRTVIGAPRSADEVERAQRLDALRLARSRTMADLQRACRPAHRGMLELALAEVDRQIRTLEAVPGPGDPGTR
ncbi:MAG: hypothetical protein ACR2LU_01335 [Luteitalea sp.]|nr:hypothetical protein [Acidobacteriota bacterium]